jgi:hypothetical protein
MAAASPPQAVADVVAWGIAPLDDKHVCPETEGVALLLVD